MGFWQTGYSEHHEQTGLENWQRTPPVYRCRHCCESFNSTEELCAHKFHAHPSKRPMLFLCGIEVGDTPVHIRIPLSAGDVQVANCKRAWINNIECELSAVDRKLCAVTNDTVQVRLANKAIFAKKKSTAVFTICFEIPCENDLASVDRVFHDMRRNKRLDKPAMEDFIVESREFPTASRYLDGICDYLYGVLIKEQRDSTLPYEKYCEKWNQAANKLQGFDRPLARIISALIAFHYNQFDECIALAGNSRVGAAAARYKRWLGNDNGVAGKFAHCKYEPGMDEMLTDQESDTVIKHCVSAPAELAQQLGVVEALICDDIPQVDQSKLRVLLVEFHAHTAKRHMRELMHRDPFRVWAKRIAL